MHVALARSRQPEQAGTADDPLVEVLARHGVEAARPCWDDGAVDWAAFDLVVVRTTWDYADRREAFLSWAGAVATRTPVLNPVDTLRWNTHKSYLLELEERGAPVVPTAWLGRGDRVRLDDVLAARAWPEAVVKPAVGVGGEGVTRVARPVAAADQEVVDDLLDRGDVLVQPFLTRIETAGERSVVVVDGVVSHAVRKVPARGEHRVHAHRGGRHERVEVDPDVGRLAEWVVSATGGDLLVARVDLVEDEVGAPQVLELEATDPELSLDLAPEGAIRLGEAILRRLEADAPISTAARGRA